MSANLHIASTTHIHTLGFATMIQSDQRDER